MPTTRPRLTVTETPDVERRLDRAAAAFPELAGQRKALLLRLTELGEQYLDQERLVDRREAAKRRIIARTNEFSVAEGEAILAAREANWGHELELYW